jgi:large subunit ribosomal protein L24
MRIKTGDLVQVIAGKKDSKGKQGKVLKVLKDKNRVVVEGVNMITKHLKPSQQNPDGGTQVVEGSIHVSNVMLVDPKTKKPTRVGYEFKDNKKVRVAKKSGTVLTDK